MWCVGNTPTWQVVVHDKMGGEFDGEIVTMRTTQKNVLMRTQQKYGMSETHQCGKLWCMTKGAVTLMVRSI